MLTHLEQGALGAPLGLKQLYLGSLGAFANSDPARVEAVLARTLNDSHATVRHAAVGLAAKLAPSPRLKSLLQQQLRQETDPHLQGAIQRQLSQG